MGSAAALCLGLRQLGKTAYVLENPELTANEAITNEFVCDGTYTYFLQADGTAMKDRLTYHPDGVHVIYFDQYGHEVFSDFAHVKKSIAGEPVDDYCFFGGSPDFGKQ